MTPVHTLDTPKAIADDLSLAQRAEALGAVFATRAQRMDDEDAFVARNFQELRAAGLLEVGVPRELGGGGAAIPELSLMLRTLARHCGSTALALAMHTHQVAIPAWRWRHGGVAAVEPLLRRVAGERLVLVSTGGSDWVGGGGEAVRAEGGYRIQARKVFSSGAPVGDLMMTMAILREGDGPGEVLHFAVPFASPNVKVLDTWHTLGMRATGSHDILIDGHLVPEAGVSLRRPAGEWHPVFQVIATIAIPLIYSVYVGVAESARDLAVALARRRAEDPHARSLVGRMDTELMGARLALDGMLAVIAENAPSADTVNRVMMGRQLATRHALAVGELAMEAAGGAAFFRKNGLERRFRDLQGARYHPMQAGPQAEYAGCMALGLGVETVY